MNTGPNCFGTLKIWDPNSFCLINFGLTNFGPEKILTEKIVGQPFKHLPDTFQTPSRHLPDTFKTLCINLPVPLQTHWAFPFIESYRVTHKKVYLFLSILYPIYMISKLKEFCIDNYVFMNAAWIYLIWKQ